MNNKSTNRFKKTYYATMINLTISDKNNQIIFSFNYMPKNEEEENFTILDNSYKLHRNVMKIPIEIDLEVDKSNEL